jgi:hypothetical protein
MGHGNFKINSFPSGLHKFPKELYPNVVRGILLQIGWSMTMGAPHLGP